MANCVNTSNYFWKIENFCSTNKKVSPVLFSVGLKWQLRFSRFTDDDTEKCFLFLHCLNVTEKSSTWQFIAAILLAKEDGTYSKLKHGKYNLGDGEWCVFQDSIPNISKQHGLIKDITFYLRITPVDLESFLKNSKSVEEVYSETLCANSLGIDFAKVFNSDLHSDFVLQCGEKTFYVNKTVLSARSDFFAGMFRSDWKEVMKGYGSVEGIEPEILELILQYLYTGHIPELSKKSLQVLYTNADRFGVESLKVKCFSLLMDKFVETPKEYSEKESTSESTEVVKVESQVSKELQLVKNLFMSQEWRALSHEYPQKAQEMCRQYLLKY